MTVRRKSTNTCAAASVSQSRVLTYLPNSWRVRDGDQEQETATAHMLSTPVTLGYVRDA